MDENVYESKRVKMMRKNEKKVKKDVDNIKWWWYYIRALERAQESFAL